MKNEHDFERALSDYHKWFEETACGGNLAEYLGVCGLEAVEAALEIAAEQKTVDVEELKKNLPSEYTPDIEEYDPWEDIGFLEEYFKVCGWNKCINHLAAQGYLRTPDTEKDRVLELMAGALETAMKSHRLKVIELGHGSYNEFADAISEYEKLKGGA